MLIELCLILTSTIATEPPVPPSPRATPPPMILDTLGEYRRPVTTTSMEARAWFDQGMALLYGFNHEGATLSFLEATRHDPGFAMAWWGISCANGPNINDPMMTENEQAAAYVGMQRALEYIENEESPANRGLIRALQGRYTYPNPEDHSELDLEYAKRLRVLHEQYPHDPDIAAMTAEALMNTQSWEYWEDDGSPKGACDEFRTIIETTMLAYPMHPAANHLYIHIMEASPNPQRAESAADRLSTLMPGSGHLVHMPSHIWVHTGRYEEALECNRRGYQLDNAWFDAVPESFDYRGYTSHNRHFLVYAAMMQGAKEDAISVAWTMQEAPEDLIRMYAPYVDSSMAAPWHAMIRFGEWQQVLDSPMPPEWRFISVAVAHSSRAIAFANLGRSKDARAELARFDDAVADIPDGWEMAFNPPEEGMKVMRLFTEGEMLFKEGRRSEGLAILEEAVALEDSLRYAEPPVCMQPIRHALGALLLVDGQYKKAEGVFMEDLERHPRNGWALLGLRDALIGQERSDEAASINTSFRTAWRNADVMPPAACYCGSTMTGN